MWVSWGQVSRGPHNFFANDETLYWRNTYRAQGFVVPGKEAFNLLYYIVEVTDLPSSSTIFCINVIVVLGI
ncbi:hypothetical protein Ccrd_021010 [Cynara cardunculus var. scolymus]|uniref:Uncharacterized protein n=1 Tax=Cynara cardunculus var. scolymus TaxID=59895 RepID=A0A124SEP9_CYNCS|nr:hypothetical protein Ccrd_021010 [Cynara cardunculus var. scolymus]